MKTNLTLAREACLAGVVVFLAVPAINAPASLRAPITSADASVLALTHNLSSPNPSIQPKPLKSWVCVSSWYGDDFDGQPTATGELYDMYAMTAAHPTLPLGSVVRVVDLRTRRSAVVRINDRGPYVAGRDLDVSYQVARQLGFLHRGLARVRLELLEVPPSRLQPPNN